MENMEMQAGDKNPFLEGKRSPELTKILAMYKTHCADARSLDELADAARDAGSLDALLASNSNPKKPAALPEAVRNAEEEFKEAFETESV